MQPSVLPENGTASPNLDSNPSTHSSAQYPRPLELRVKVALVTGAAKGIGRGIALRLAQDGYRVAACDLPSGLDLLHSLGEEIQAQHTNGSAKIEERYLILTADVSSEKEVQNMVKECTDILGGLDVMVANAGIAIVKPLLETSGEDFDCITSVNLRGVMLCYKYAAIQMIAQGRGGRIIGASSMNGKVGAPNLSSYSATKFGVRGLTQSAALEWAKYKITVNCYAPARIHTSMLEQYDIDVTSRTPGMKRGDFMQQLRDKTPLGDLAGPEEVASLVSYLASPEAHFITGQTLSINGGAMLD